MSDHILEAAQPTIGNIPPQARPDTGTGIMPNCWWASPDDPVWKSLPVTHLQPIFKTFTCPASTMCPEFG